ncbi:hypothetical protein GCM10027436_54680 [Actinophytocola sediminis]
MSPTYPELKVAVATGELDGGVQYDDAPKSDSGKRTISLSVVTTAEISEHLKAFAQPGPDGRLLGQPEGTPGPDRAFQHSGCHDLPAPDLGARSRDRGSAGPHDPGRTGAPAA